MEFKKYVKMGKITRNSVCVTQSSTALIEYLRVTLVASEIVTK